MSLPQRISLKCFLNEPLSADNLSGSDELLTALIPVYHRWIRDKTLSGLLLDVADYRHVAMGPGVILIGHEADYGLDLTAGRPGLLCTRKRINSDASSEGKSLKDVLKEVIELTQAAVSKLAQETPAGQKLSFDTQSWELMALDRLTSAQEDFDAVQEEVSQAFSDSLGPVTLTNIKNDQREALTISIKAENAVTIEA